MIRRALASGVLAVLMCSGGAAEILPQYDLEWVCLRARLIVEARRVEPGVVEILRVHHGNAQVGDRIALRRFEDLPQRAFREVPRLEERGKGAPLDGCTAVLFLESADEGGFEPAGWGSGVKWVVEGRIFGHRQLWNPGDYLLLPDDEADSLDALRSRIAAELVLRREFESNLVLMKPEERAQALMPYVFRVPRDACSWAAQERLLREGDAAGALLVSRAEEPATEEQRRLIAELLGRLRYPGGAGFIGRLFDEQMPRMRKFPKSPSREDNEALYRWQRTVYWLAETATPWNGVNPRLLAALRWAVERRDPEVLESATRGLGRAPEPATVPILAKALADWPSGGEGEEEQDRNRAARLSLVRCLGEHRLPACVPVLARILDDPDPEVAEPARACLEEIVGEDLGGRPEPWVEWLAGLAK